jgi:hypothetical protein
MPQIIWNSRRCRFFWKYLFNATRVASSVATKLQIEIAAVAPGLSPPPPPIPPLVPGIEVAADVDDEAVELA